MVKWIDAWLGHDTIANSLQRGVFILNAVTWMIFIWAIRLWA